MRVALSAYKSQGAIKVSFDFLEVHPDFDEAISAMETYILDAVKEDVPLDVIQANPLTWISSEGYAVGAAENHSLWKVRNVTYDLPTHALMTLNFLFACEDLFTRANWLMRISLESFYHAITQAAQQDREEKITQMMDCFRGAQDTIILGRKTEYKRDQKFNCLVAMILFEAAQLHDYSSVKKALSLMHYLSYQAGTPFYFAIKEHRFDLIEEVNEKLPLTNLIIKESVNSTLINAFCRYFQPILAKKEPALDKLIECWHFRAKRMFFEGCIKEKAHDNTSFTWKYGEMIFWMQADYSLERHKEGDRISIDVAHSEYYKQYVNVDGEAPHELFERQLTHVAKMLALEFAQDCNFRRKITFTPESSQRLIAAGLHLTPAYFKSLLGFHHRWIFLLSKDESAVRDFLFRTLEHLHTISYSEFTIMQKRYSMFTSPNIKAPHLGVDEPLKSHHSLK